MLKVFYKKFHKERYIKFNRLDKYIKQVLKETFMTKKICISRLKDYVSQCLIKFVIDEQLLI